jgi:hypothetical protein
LEDRLAPAVVFEAGVLTVTGTARADTIVVVRNADTLEVTLNGVVTPGFPLADVTRLRLRGKQGADTLRVGADVTVTATLTGGAGADDLQGGVGPDRLRGGGGADTFRVDPADTVADFQAGLDVWLSTGPVPVVTGPFTDPGLLGVRTDLVPGAPDVNDRSHRTGPISYTGHSNPPTYGPHHPHPLATGVYTTPQDDADLVHNLEHGHVWVSYDPARLTGAARRALKRLVESFGPQAGIVLTPRPGNPAPVALASWAHLLTLQGFNAPRVYRFLVTNRGHAPEGFITP